MLAHVNRSRRLLYPLAALVLIASGGCDPGRAPARTLGVPAGVTSLVRAEPIADAFAEADELLAGFRALAGPGMGVHTVDFEGAPGLLLVAVDLAMLRPMIVGTDGDRRIGVTGREALADHGAALVVGSSFVSELNSTSPVGLLRIEGQTLSELQRHGYTRVLGVHDGRVGVVSIRSYHRELFDSAMQVGPGIVEEGAIDISERDLKRPRYYRTFVATCGPTAVAGVSLVPMNLYSLGRRFLEAAESLGLACDEVVNLAGDREVVLAMASVDGARMAYVGHPETTKAAVLVFLR